MLFVVVVVLVRVFFFFFNHSNRKIVIEAMLQNLENLPGLLRGNHSRQDSKWLPSGIHTTSEEGDASAD